MVSLPKLSSEIGAFILITGVFFVSRVAFLTYNPIFTDEAIYLRWAQIALQDPAWTFISLSDGKQPLFIWLVMPLLRIFSDPLMAGRVVSVMAGFASMIGVGLLSYILFKNKWIGFLTSLLYLIYPMAYVYDRLAIYDSLVGTFYIYGLLLALLLIKLRRLDITLLFGLVLGGGLLNKSSSMFILYLLPFILYMSWLLYLRKFTTRSNYLLLYGFVGGVMAFVFLMQDLNRIVELMLLGIWVVLIMYYRFESSVSFLLALLMLSMTPILLIFGKEIIAENAAIWTYFFLVAGTCQAIYELWRKPRNLLTYESVIPWKRRRKQSIPKKRK